MPKRTMSENDHTGYFLSGTLPTWRAAGLSLAVIGTSVWDGIAALGAVVIAAVVVFALERLHRRVPDAPSTGDLVGSTLGPAAARFTGMIQLTAYAVFAARFAVSLGSLSFDRSADPESAAASLWWPALSLVFVALAATLVAVLPTRTVAAVATVLAAVGLLVVFYVGLAITAKVFSGTPTGHIAADDSPSGLLLLAALIPLGLGLVGFEVASASTGRLRSAIRPLGAALAAIAVCTVTVLVAVNVATADGYGFQYAAGQFWLIVPNIFDEPSPFLSLAGGIPLACAATLTLTWAAARVASRLFGTGITTSTLVPVVIAVLTVISIALVRYHNDIYELVGMVAALLLLVVYVLVAEANSRVPGAAAAVQAPRAVMLATAVGVVFIPLYVSDFVPDAWRTLGVTVLVLGVAALLSGVGRAVQPTPQPR